MGQELHVVGKSFSRVDGMEKATGSAVYGQDLRRPGMLIGKILRSKYPHARILSIDTSAAEALPGVQAVVTQKDLPPGLYGQTLIDETTLASDRVRFLGEAVAAVAATEEAVAEQALDLIRVEYEELPAVFDPEEAMKEDAPLLHPDLDSYLASKIVKGTGNVCSHTSLRRGDVEEGFGRADFVFEDTFRTQMVYHAYMEPHAALAEVDGRGRVTVWVTTQGPFMVRTHLTEIFHLPMTHVRVIGVQCGGGFGGKTRSIVAPLCVVLAMKTGRPVKIALTRPEDFVSSHPRHPSVIRIKSGVMKDGSLVARQATAIMDTGAYSDFGPAATSNATSFALGPYVIPNIQSDGYCVYTNKTSCGALRAPGATQACFAVESHMDKIARKLGIDPLELRLKNAVGEGDQSPTGQVYGPIGLKGALRAIQEHLAQQEDRQEIGGVDRAWGIACAVWAAGGTTSAAQIKINEDGTVSLLTGAVDIGTGSDTVLSQIAAEELGVRLEDISIITGDTDVTPYDMASVANRITFTMGNAVRLAAADARQQLFERASQMLEANPRDLEASDRMVRVKGSPDRAVPIARIAATSHVQGGQILGRGSYTPVLSPYDTSGVKGHLYPSRAGDCFSAQAAEIEIDRETGDVRILRLATVHDVGRLINPTMAEGQVEGGLSLGLGFVLSEQIVFDRGRTVNAGFQDYRLPTAMDMPGLHPVFLEDPKGDGPFGSKPLGESPNIATSAAISNAIYNAAGIRLYELPITPDRVRAALREQG